MSKKKQQKQSRFARNNFFEHLINAEEINRQDREYLEQLSQEERNKKLIEKQRSEEAYRQWEKESEDSSSTSGGIINAVKNTASAVINSAKNVSLQDIPDTYRMWTEGLYTMFKDEDLEKIREASQEEEEIKMMARYKQLNLIKSDLEKQLDAIDDLNSEKAINVLDSLNQINDEISKYDQYFLNEGRTRDVISQQMFDFNKLSTSDIARLHSVYAFNNIKNVSFEDYAKNPFKSAGQDLLNIGNLATGIVDYASTSLGGVIDHYLQGNGYSYDSYMLGKAIGYLDKDDPILKKAYKGGNTRTPKDIALSIDSNAVGEYDNSNNYNNGTWYNQSQRKKNKSQEDYFEHKQFLKDGKIKLFGSLNDGLNLDIVDFEDINPQFRKEHEEYGKSFTDIIAHPLHGIVETNSTVGMLAYQLPQMGAAGVAKLAAQRFPAIAAVSLAMQPSLGIWGARESRQEETATEAMDAITQRVVKDVTQNGGDIQKITDQIIQQANLANIDLSDYVTTRTDENGQQHFIPKDESSLQEILKVGTAYNFSTTDKVFEQAKLDSRKGINKLINANNALAAYDYIQTLPFTSYWGSAMRGSAATMSRKAVQDQLEKNIMKQSFGDKIITRITGGKLTPAQQKLLQDSSTETRAIVDKAIDKATSKYLGKDIQKALKARDVAKYLKNKVRLLGFEGAIEGLEEVNQTMLQNRYSRGEYDDYNKSVSMFDINELSENIALSINGIGNLLGINTSDPDNADNELRKAFNIGFASSILFAGGSHALKNIYGADESNLSQLLVQLKDDSTLAKVVSEQQSNTQDLVHLGMFYDALKQGKRSASYMKERLDFLKQNLDKENSLVTDGFIDADKRLVDAMDLVLNNENLTKIIDSYKPKSFNKKSDNESISDIKKRFYVNAAKAVADSNTASDLVSSIGNTIDSSFYELTSAVDRLFMNGQVTDEQLKQFEDEHPRLYKTLQSLLNDYAQYKLEVLKQYEKNKKEWISENRKSSFVLDVDFSQEYDAAQIDEMENALQKDEDFVANEFISAIIRQEATGTNSRSLAAAAKELIDPKNRRRTIERAYELKKGGFSQRDFVMDRLYSIFLNEQKNAAIAVQNQIKNKAELQKRIQELTGLDIDISRIIGIEKAIDEIVDNYTKRIDKLLGNDKRQQKIDLNDIFTEDYRVDDDFISEEMLQSWMLAKAMKKPMDIRKNTYLYGQQNPITIKNFLNSSADEIVKNADEYAKLLDNLRNGSLSEEVTAFHDNEKKLKELSEKAVKDFILNEIKDQEKRRYIANKRRKQEPASPNDVELAQNGDEEAAARINKNQTENDSLISQDVGEKTAREKFNGGQKQTKSEKQKIIQEQRDKLEQIKNAQQSPETLVDDEEDVDSISEQEELKDEFDEALTGEQSEEDLQNPEQDEPVDETEPEEEQVNDEDASNDSDDHVDDEGPEDIPVVPEENESDEEPEEEPSGELSQDEEPSGELTDKGLDESDSGELSEEAQAEVLSEDEQDQSKFFIGAEEEAFHNLSVEPELDMGGDAVVTNENGERVDTSLVEGQLEQLIEMESGTLDQNESSFDGTNKTASEDTIGDMISDVLFYDPDPKDEKGNPVDETIKLRVNGKDVKLPKPLATGRELAKKLTQKNWFAGTKKYWIVTQSLESSNTKQTEAAKDTMTVCLIIEDDKNCYAVTYRRLGEIHSVKKDSKGNVVETYTKDKEQDLRDELYVKGMSWSKLVKLGQLLGIQVTTTEPKTAKQRAKIAKPIFEARAKEIARGIFTGDPTLGRGSDSQFERWFKGLRPSEYKLGENDPQYLEDRDKRKKILEESYEMARRYVMKGGRLPITMKQIDNQINLLRKNRNEIIDAYLTLVEDNKGHKHFEFPEEVRTDVIPNHVSQSNGKININTIPGTKVHKFSNIMPDKTLEEIAESVESGDVVFGFGLGKFGSEYEAIQQLFTPVTDRVLLTTEDGRSIGVGKAGKIYMLVDSPTGSKVPIMLQEQKFDRQYVEVNGKLQKIYLDDEDSWNDSKGSVKFRECFEIDPNTGRPKLIENNEGYKPSIAEILFYMVCGKFNTPNLTINPEYFIHNGERTLIEGTDKLKQANDYLGPKQLYFGPVDQNGQPLQIQRGSNDSISLSNYGLIIGMRDEDGVYRQRLFMHDELFSTSEQSAADRRLVIKAIAQQMHWSMDSFLLTQHADVNEFDDSFGNFVNYVFNQNPGKEECSFYGCPDLTFKRSDFLEQGNGDLKKSRRVQYFAWCLKNGKLRSDLNFEDPFYAPFVFGKGVKNTNRKDANNAAEKLGATEQKPAQLTSLLGVTEESLMLKNTEYEEEYWNDFLGIKRKTLFNRIQSFLKRDDEKKQLFDQLNLQAGAKEHGGFRDIIVFRFPKDNLSSDEAFKYLDEKIKDFVEKYNTLHKDKNPIKYSTADLNQIKARLSTEYANKKALPIMNIYEDGTVKIYTRPMSGQFMNKDTEGFTGMYSTKRGSGRMDKEKSRKWLQKKLGLREDQIFITDAILRGTHDEAVFGITNVSSDAVRQGLFGDGYIMLSSQAGIGIEYHEGWHFVNLLLHDKQTRRAIHNSYIKTHKYLNKAGVTYEDVEEAMAEDFRKWVINQSDQSILGRVKRAFSQILDFLFYTENKHLYKQVYKDIQAGRYSGMPLDQESVDEFHDKYNEQLGAYSKIHGIPSVSDKVLENMTHVLTHADFFETLDGIVNAISCVLNFDSIEKIKSYSGKNFDEIVQIVKDLRDRQVDERNVQILDDFIQNPSIIKKALQDYLLSIGINFKVKKVKQQVVNLDGEAVNEEIQIGQDPEDEALQKEDSYDNTWDKIDLSTSHKDNAALRAKMFLKRVPMLRRNYDQNGKVQYTQVVDKFGTPVYWKYDEVWNLVMNELWSCDTLDQIDEKTNQYSSKSIRGKIKNLARSNAMFYALDQKFDDIEGDIQLRSQIFTTISASKNPVMIGMIQDAITKVYNFDDFGDNISLDGENEDSRSKDDSGSVEDRKRVFSFSNDSGLQVARNIPRTWSKNAALNGLVVYNAKTRKSTISKKFAEDVLKQKQNLLNLIKKYKSRKLKKGETAYTEDQLRNALYGENGIRETFKSLCNQLGIPVDNDVVDAYVSMFIQNKGSFTLQDQINAFSEIMSDSSGSLSKIIDDISKNAGDDYLVSSDRKVRNLDQIFNNYSENSNIGKLAIAYNYIHPQLSEYAVRDANGNLIYPINMPNELTDKTNSLNKDSKLAEDMSKSKLCEHSIILEASKKVDKNSPSTQLRLNTFAGLKDVNAGEGSDHAGLTALEDVLCKMFLTEMDHIIFPTMADKKTWQSLSSSNIKLTHDLLLVSPRKSDEIQFAVEEYEKIEEYDPSKYKSQYSYRTKAYKWYLNLPEESEIKQRIYEQALEVSKQKGQLSYKRFSDETLRRFAKLFLDEINSLIDYYDENHIAELVKNPNKLITNFHGNVSNGRMDFSGNGGKFRYFYDTYLSKDFAQQGKSGRGLDAITNALDMNLNQKLNALFELQKQIESFDGIEAYTRDKSGEKQIDPAFSKMTSVQAFGKPKDQCDGFELIRQFLDDLKKEVVENGEFTNIVLDSINDKLVKMTEMSLQQFSRDGDIMQLIEKDPKTGLYSPKKIPLQLLKPYLDKMINSGMISEYTSIYSYDKTLDDVFAETQAVYSLIANFTVNTILSVMEVEKIYTGEKADYKWKKAKSTMPVRLYDYKIGDSLIDVTVEVESLDDVFSDKIKRLGGTQSPGNKLRSDFSDDELAFDPTLKGNLYTVCNVEDIEIPSAHLDIIFQNFKTQLIVDRVRRRDVEFFEKYINEQINKRKEENEKLAKEGKSQKSNLTRERIIDRLYNDPELVNQIYSSLSEEEKQKIDIELASQVKPYTNITVSDAQVFIRPALYRKMRIRLGEWTIEPDESGYSDEIAYNICESDDLWMKDPKKSAIVQKFQINALKMSYFQNNPFNDAGMNVNKAIYNKMALFPLFKMHRSTDFGRALYDRMNLKGDEIDQIAFKSAVKVGAVKKAPSVEKQISGIEQFVKDKYGISKSSWNRLKSYEKLKYQIEYSKLDEVKNALNVVNEKFEVSRNGNKVSAKYKNQYSVDYTTDDVKKNESTEALPISVQDLRNIRLQLNTRAHESEERAIGTQMFKLAFSNIIDTAEYGTGKSGRQSRLGSKIKADIIRCILRITNIGIDDIRKEFYNKDGGLNRQAVRDYVKKVAINNGLGESAQQLLAEGAVAAALMSRSVFEHSVSSHVNKKVIDINTKGGTAIQQSPVGFSGYGNDSVSTYNDSLYQKYNNGEELNWNAKEGSMEVLLSMNFFKQVIPRNVWAQGHNARRQWLIDNDIIKGTKTDGTQSNPKPFGVGYRIPTQGMSSMFSYIVADVLPEQVGDLIVVPREFTAQTGSDYDVDKIFLCNYSYKITDTDSQREVENRDENDTIGAIGNTLIDNYIDIISDRRNFANARASIDVITNTIQSELLPVLRGSNNQYVEGMTELLPYFQTLRKLEFGVGKTGIGPFALNVTNLSLTQFTHLTMDFGKEGLDFDLMPLDSIEGQDGRRISDWLSAMVNAHVDVAKDAYVRDLNVNQFTYNHANLLLRCGKGITTFSFLAQPILKLLSDHMNNSGGVYGDNYDGKTPTQISKSKRKKIFEERLYNKYRTLLEDIIDSDKLSKENKDKIAATIEWVKWNFPRQEEVKEIINAKEQAKKDKNFKNPELPLNKKDVFDFNVSVNVISAIRNSSDVNELANAYMHQIQVLYSFERLDKYAQSLSELVQCSQIDTKKFGNTIPQQRNFVNKLNRFRSQDDNWIINDSKFIQTVPIREGKKKPLKKDISYMALKKYFEDMFLDKKLNSAVRYTKGILENQLFTATDAYDDIFTTLCSVMFGKDEIECVDGKKYSVYGTIYKDETLQAIANGIDDIIRYNVFMNQGPRSLKVIRERGNDLAIDFIKEGKDYIRQNMKRILFGDKNQQPIFNRVAKLIKDIKKDPYAKDGYLDLINENGEISNQFLLYLSPQTANDNYPIGRMLLSTSQMNVSSYIKRQLMAGFDQLLNSEDEEIRQLAEDLAFYAYFSTYDQNVVNGFFDLVPPDYRKQYDSSMKYALNHNHKIGVLGAITGMPYSDEEYKEDRKSTETNMVRKAVNEIIDILSRNFWFNDNIVPRFFSIYDEKNNTFAKKGGDVLPPGIYDDVSQRSFQPWIATTRRDSIYLKVRKGKTTILYKKVGVVTKVEKTDKENPKVVSEFNIYAAVPKAGLHSGNINQFEFYCNYNTPSIFEDNKIISEEFALDSVQKQIQSELDDLKDDENYVYSFKFNDGITEIDPMYVSTNDETYYHDTTFSIKEHSKEQSTKYAEFKRSVSAADREGVNNSDWVINLVSEDKGAEVNRSTSKPLQEIEYISDSTLDSNTSDIVEQIVKSGKQDIVIYITSTFAEGIQSTKEEMENLRKEKEKEYLQENQNIKNAQSLAEKHAKSFTDYELDEEITENKILVFLDKLVYDLKIAGVRVKQLSAPLGRNRKPVAFGVISAHKTHSDFFGDSKAIIYPVDKFVNGHKKQFYNFVVKVQNMIDESPVTEDVVDIQENAEEFIENAMKEVEKKAEEAIKDIKASVDNKKQEPVKKTNRFASSFVEDSIVDESSEDSSFDHEDC